MSLAILALIWIAGVIYYFHATFVILSKPATDLRFLYLYFLLAVALIVLIRCGQYISNQIIDILVEKDMERKRKLTQK